MQVRSFLLPTWSTSEKSHLISQSNQSLIEWLERCNTVRRLDFRPRQRVKDSIKTAMKVKIPPCAFKLWDLEIPSCIAWLCYLSLNEGGRTLQLTMLLKQAPSDGSRVMSGIKILYPILQAHSLHQMAKEGWDKIESKCRQYRKRSKNGPFKSGRKNTE